MCNSSFDIAVIGYGCMRLDGKKALLSWSSGLDSAWALYELRKRGEVEVVGLLTTVDPHTGAVGPHIPLRLVQEQAAAIGLPLHCVDIPSGCDSESYDRAMSAAMDKAKQDGIEVIAFGDMFLGEVRAYRERQLQEPGLSPLFPLWGRNTVELAYAMIDGGLRAHVIAADITRVPRELIDLPFDELFIRSLPLACDACGANGEFHTFVLDGPMFKRSLEIRADAIVAKDEMVFAKLASPLA